MPNSFRKIVEASLICGGVFITAYAIEIGVDVWIVNNEPGPRAGSYAPPAIHVRHYLLPVGGFALAAVLFLRQSVPAGRETLRIIESGGVIGAAIRPAIRTLVWAFAAAAVFQVARCLQWHLFGVFLPP
jgi:hypothetical protein